MDQFNSRPYEWNSVRKIWLCFTIVVAVIVAGVLEIEFSIHKKPSWFTKLRASTLLAIGLCLNIIIVILLSNSIGSLAPNFNDACKPDVITMCQNQTAGYMQMKCTTDPKQWMPAVSSFPHRMSSIWMYLTTVLFLWGGDRLYSQKNEVLWGGWCAPVVGLMPLMLSGLATIASSETSFGGILLGYLIGWAMAYFCVKIVLVSVIPNWFNNEESMSIFRMRRNIQVTKTSKVYVYFSSIIINCFEKKLMYHEIYCIN